MNYIQSLLNWLFSAFALLLLVAGSVSLLLTGIYIRQSFLIFVSSFLISLILVGLITWLLCSAVWNFFVKTLRKIYYKLHGNLITKIVALGIVGFFLPFIPIQFFAAILTFVSTLFSTLFTEVVRIGLQQQSCDVFSDPNCVTVLTSSLFGLWADSINKAYSAASISSLPLGELFIFFVIWIILVEIIYKITTASQRTQQTTGWIETLYADPNARSNTIFFVILGISLYLSVAAIAAIPNLASTEVTPVLVTAESLQKRFSSSIDKFKSQFPIEVDVDPSSTSTSTINILNPSEDSPFSNLEALIEREQLRLANDTSTTDNSALVNLQSSNLDENDLSKLKKFLNEQKQNRSRAINRANELLIYTRGELEAMARNATTEYQYASIGRKGSRETIDHFQLITDWFDTNSSQMESRINSCMSTVRAGDQNFEVSADILATSLSSSDNNAFQSNFSVNGSLLFDPWSDAYEICRVQEYFPPVPRRPALGSYLGPFSFVARWLLSTESLSLALITGLLGFGLLGSACSSFVRERLEPQHNQLAGPLVRDLPKVVIIGLSAAILAFLSVMGGLAVFFSTGSDPNPYALLLACLIAAAFGEDVWQWARGRLQENLRDREKEISGKDLEPTKLPQESSKEDFQVSSTDIKASDIDSEP